MRDMPKLVYIAFNPDSSFVNWNWARMMSKTRLVWERKNKSDKRKG